MTSLKFEIHHQSESCNARIGTVTTPHGSFDTPRFMPVGTQATVKGLFPDMVANTGAKIILANTYHLMLRPGSPLVEEMGGLHKWMRWDKPILTDSGGFQVFSLSKLNKITEEGVKLRSHIDGRLINFTPEYAIEIQNQLGADIIMAFDDCPPAQQAPDHDDSAQGLQKHNIATQEYEKRVQDSCNRTLRWLERCIDSHTRKNDQALFGIIQGGTNLEQRSWCVGKLAEFDLPGYAIGGVAVGEGYEQLKKVVQHTAPLMPEMKPRYLMGVGYERDILTAVRAGIDMFDCVLPTRNARNANAFTPTGQIRLVNAKFKNDPKPIDQACDCAACAGGYSRSYLQHL